MRKARARFARVSPAMVVAMLALLLALGGVSTAAQIAKPQANEAKKKPKVKRGPRGLRGLRGVPGPRGANGDRGEKGDRGDRGDKGEKGDKGDKGEVPSSGNWGTVDRNSIGSPVTVLRAGPITTSLAGGINAPPFGKGSLSILVANDDPATGADDEKAAYGNQVDFFGDLVNDLTAVGFRVWTSGENSGVNNIGGGVNMPSISFEIDPNLDAAPTSNFSTMVWVPAANSPSNQWSGYLDATTTGTWFLTGAAGAATLCNQATPCTFNDVKTRLDDGGDPATIYIAQVQKGRDKAWQGAVDGFRINNEVFDFEEHGVNVLAP